MHIKGGLNGQRGNPVDPTDEGVFVSKINSSGAARRDGRLKVKNTNQMKNTIKKELNEREMLLSGNDFKDFSTYITS